ncbi:microtubule-binding protein [Hafnia phage vB_HpaA_yong1]|uniref:Microtubule-binding protein n=1 Tax=Hafnia phage vB_HpaA_yong1 TaxID=2562199 RepID=A0A482MIK3_9CAUD|nr:microtubule-binding protein [Hafnia phage vB_HpaA_yong1]
MFGKSKLKAQIKELSMKAAYLERAVVVLDKDNERLKDKLAESERKRLTPPEAVTVKRMVGIKFKALFNGMYQPAEFKTGPGNCGKNVKHFTISKTERTLTIHQHHIDGSQKDFEYRLSDIDGRIQYDYEQVKVYGEEAERELELQAFMQVRPRIVF